MVVVGLLGLVIIFTYGQLPYKWLPVYAMGTTLLIFWWSELEDSWTKWRIEGFDAIRNSPDITDHDGSQQRPPLDAPYTGAREPVVQQRTNEGDPVVPYLEDVVGSYVPDLEIPFNASLCSGNPNNGEHVHQSQSTPTELSQMKGPSSFISSNGTCRSGSSLSLTSHGNVPSDISSAARIYFTGQITKDHVYRETQRRIDINNLGFRDRGDGQGPKPASSDQSVIGSE